MKAAITKDWETSAVNTERHEAPVTIAWTVHELSECPTKPQAELSNIKLVKSQKFA